MKNLRAAISFALLFAVAFSSHVFAQGATPPTIAKSFGSSAVAQNSTVGVSFTISNLNGAVTLTGLSFTDALPAGLVVANPNAVTTDCGGTVTAVPGTSSISFTGGTLAPSGPSPQVVGPTTTVSPQAVAEGTCVVTVSLLVTGTGVPAGRDLGTRSTFADLGQTIAENFGVEPLAHGTSFLSELV